MARTSRSTKAKSNKTTQPTRRLSPTEALRLSEEKFAKAFRSSIDAIIISTLADGRCIEINDSFTRMTGYTREEMIGYTPAEHNIWISPADRAKLLDRLRTHGAVHRQEFDFRKKSGEVGIGLVSADVIDIAGEPCLIVIGEDITEHKQVEKALQQHAADLQIRNEELDAFAHTVAHDLKSPLGNIIGFTEWLQARPDMPAEDRQDCINIIARNATKMNNIIDELLLLAKVRKADVEFLPLDMDRIVSEALHRLAFVIAESHAAITAPKRWPEAIGYSPWVEEAWVNYLSSALKYGGHPPQIELGCDLMPDDMIRFWVHNTGSGIAPEARNDLFTAFTQLSTVRATGHGLGLSIVKHIVEKMGGQVDAQSDDSGSAFSFTLPAAT